MNAHDRPSEAGGRRGSGAACGRIVAGAPPGVGVGAGAGAFGKRAGVTGVPRTGQQHASARRVSFRGAGAGVPKGSGAFRTIRHPTVRDAVGCGVRTPADHAGGPLGTRSSQPLRVGMTNRMRYVPYHPLCGENTNLRSSPARFERPRPRPLPEKRPRPRPRPRPEERQRRCGRRPPRSRASHPLPTGGHTRSTSYPSDRSRR